MAGKSSWLARYTRSISTSPHPDPAAVSMASTFCNVRVVCVRTSPGETSSLLTGSTGPCPETCRMPFFAAACGKLCAGAGALSVCTLVLLMVVSFLSLRFRSSLGLWIDPVVRDVGGSLAQVGHQRPYLLPAQDHIGYRDRCSRDDPSRAVPYRGRDAV